MEWGACRIDNADRVLTNVIYEYCRSWGIGPSVGFRDQALTWGVLIEGLFVLLFLIFLGFFQFSWFFYNVWKRCALDILPYTVKSVILQKKNCFSLFFLFFWKQIWKIWGGNIFDENDPYYWNLYLMRCLVYVLVLFLLLLLSVLLLSLMLTAFDAIVVAVATVVLVVIVATIVAVVVLLFVVVSPE